ncbi:MAG: HAD-IB family phosphatase [Candidatus Omnitrophica bacterium]|nr:HAD-IB family phosphatase [Candidatus Omnitrophota bacterium]
MKPQLLIGCDFDGTVTLQDTLVEILDRYGSPEWRQVQERVVAGELTIREGLRQEMATVRAGVEEVRALLAERVQVDPAFPGFLNRMRERGVPVILLSGGFDLCVETVMVKSGAWPIPFLANRLRKDNGSWEVEFPYPSAACEACGHCKGDPIRAWKEQGYTAVFAGNGVTDRCGALAADLTFAKDELGTWCAGRGIAALSFDTFADIEEELKERGWI